MDNKLHLRYITLALLTVVALTFSACAASGGTSTTATPVTRATGTATSRTTHLISGPITYVAMGASDAVGVGSTQPGSQGYVPLLATRLPKGSHLVNLGISGIHLHDALTEEL